jgi:hypothetical protein
MAITNQMVPNPQNEDDPVKPVKPLTTEVNQETDTVQGQLKGLTSGSSAFVNLNENETARQSNSRGLINSTISRGAGREAAIKSAMPIATQDAKTFSDNRTNNQNTENRFLENRQNTNLNMEAAEQKSGLVKGEMTLGSQLSKDEAIQQSALSNEENRILSDLTIKRDDNLSTLSREEQDNLNELEMKRDAALQVFNIDRDNNSAQKNERLAELESSLRESEIKLDDELREAFEIKMNDEKFSDESQLQIVTTMNTIIRDTQQQIVDIGMSDRSGPQQAAAIKLVQDNRDAQLAVYDNVLTNFNDWKWGSDFTPDRVNSETLPTVDLDGGSGSNTSANTTVNTSGGNPPSGEGTGGGRQ